MTRARSSQLALTHASHIRHNRLEERFSRVGASEHFVIAETDFGAGLNFLAAWQLWRKSNPGPHACLHFISVRHQPLTRENLEGTLEGRLDCWPELLPLAEELIEIYPPAIAGTQRLVLDCARVRLTLYPGDVIDALADLEFEADAWFLDASPPDRNPWILDERIVAEMARHSKTGTSLSAFTAADDLPRLLSDIGFKVSSAPGPGHKSRVFFGQIPAAVNGDTELTSPPQTIGILGAGVAGALLAANLAGRGFSVILIDSAASPASAASGNRQGALYVKLGVDYNDQTQLALASLLFSQRFYQHFKNSGWHPTGLIQLAYSEAEADRQARFLARNQYPTSVLEPVSAEQASRLAGMPISHAGLWFPGSGWLQPKKLCENLADQPGIAHRFDFRVETLERDGARWKLTSSKKEDLLLDRVVLCAGSETPGLIPLKGRFRFKKIRGQITEVPETCLTTPALVICGPGYVNPAHQGSALVGATFDLHDPSPEVDATSNLENLRMLSTLLPHALNPAEVSKTADKARGRVAFRCTTHDYQPVAGLMKTQNGGPLGGIYLFTGLGSKGLTYAPLLAEYLGDLISGQPLCLPGNLAKRVETQRCHRPQVSKS